MARVYTLICVTGDSHQTSAVPRVRVPLEESPVERQNVEDIDARRQVTHSLLLLKHQNQKFLYTRTQYRLKFLADIGMSEIRIFHELFGGKYFTLKWEKICIYR